MGLLEAGDSTNNNVVTVQDFNIVRGAFGRAFGQPGYNAAADFNNDDVITGQDFNLLRSHYGEEGCPAP
jgi:hypothetical protein